jgi:hypothetical protein
MKTTTNLNPADIRARIAATPTSPEHRNTLFGVLSQALGGARVWYAADGHIRSVWPGVCPYGRTHVGGRPCSACTDS